MVYLSRYFDFRPQTDDIGLVLKLALGDDFGRLELLSRFRKYFEDRTETAFRNLRYKLEVVKGELDILNLVSFFNPCVELVWYFTLD